MVVMWVGCSIILLIFCIRICFCIFKLIWWCCCCWIWVGVVCIIICWWGLLKLWSLSLIGVLFCLMLRWCFMLLMINLIFLWVLWVLWCWVLGWFYVLGLGCFCCNNNNNNFRWLLWCVRVGWMWLWWCLLCEEWSVRVLCCIRLICNCGRRWKWLLGWLWGWISVSVCVIKWIIFFGSDSGVMIWLVSLWCLNCFFWWVLK